MQYAGIIAIALLSWGWAQQVQDLDNTLILDRVPKVKAFIHPEDVVRLKRGPRGRSLQRQASESFSDNFATWLPYHQDLDTVPSTAVAGPDFGGDTILSNGAGCDLNLDVSPECSHTLFERFYELGAFPVTGQTRDGRRFTWLSNYLHPDSAFGTQSDTIVYIGGGVAERYDIIPPPGQTIYIKGAAAMIVNNFFTFVAGDTQRACTPVTGEVSGGPWGDDNVYTIGYLLYGAENRRYQLDREGTVFRNGTGVKFPPITGVAKGLNEVRIGGYGVSRGQCVRGEISFLEELDYAYFPSPVVACGSYYVALRFDLYTPNDNMRDTLCILIGPPEMDVDEGDRERCFPGDTNFLGRNMVFFSYYRRSQNRFVAAGWVPQYLLFAPRGYDLNFMLFPIIYIQDGTSPRCRPVQRKECQDPGSIAVRNGSQGISLPYPNPATDCMYVGLETPAVASVQFMLYTADGRLAQRWTRYVGAGNHTVSLDVNVPAGAYILVVQSPYGGASFWVNILR